MVMEPLTYWLSQIVEKTNSMKIHQGKAVDPNRLVMSSNNASSAVTYTSISSDSDGPSWGIPLMNVSELSEMDPYEEVAQQRQAPPCSPSALSQGYIIESDQEEDPKEDSEEDPIDYAADTDDMKEDKEEVEESS
ncbi:hypothetical protein Tco_0307599 [Tanacetum coccineum]